MFCKKCGMQLNDNVKFCQKCGTPIPQQQKAIVNANQNGGQNTSQNTRQNVSQKRKQNSKKGIFLILLLVVLIVSFVSIGLIIWNVTKTDHSNNSENDKHSDTVLEDEKDQELKEESNDESKTEESKDDKFTVSKEDPVTEETSGNSEALRGTVKDNYSEIHNRNYVDILQGLRASEKVQNADRETMMSMLNTLLLNQRINRDQKICFNQISNEKAQFNAYCIVDSGMLKREPEYVDGEYLYSKEELNKAVWDFYYGENIQWKSDVGTEDKGDYIKFNFGDGDPWYILNSCDIRQNGDFYLVSGPCFYGDNGGTEDILEFYIDAVFEKNEKSRYGVTLCYVETYTQEKKVQSAAATSNLADYQDKSYGADKLIYGNAATPWVEGVDGTGVGEQIILSLPGTTTVHGILLYNGYLQTDDLHSKNGIVTRVSVDFGNGVVVEEDVWDPTMYVEDPIPSRVELDQSVKTDKIVITILDAKSGTKYDDTCIGEIIVF